MNATTLNWMLAGALVASLAWNAKVCFRPKAAEVVPLAPTCLPGPDLSKLALSAEQERALESWRANSCEPSCRTESEADAKLKSLHAALRDPAATPESLRALAGEINQLRAHSLETCVDSILEVRRVLSKEQLNSLMMCCDSRTCSDP